MIHRRTIRKAGTTTAALAAIAVWGAAPAGAGESEYLRPLLERFPFLSAQQLLAEGYKVCHLMEQGFGASNAVPMVSKDLAVSLSVANEIVSAASREFGC